MRSRLFLCVLERVSVLLCTKKDEFVSFGTYSLLTDTESSYKLRVLEDPKTGHFKSNVCGLGIHLREPFYKASNLRAMSITFFLLLVSFELEVAFVFLVSCLLTVCLFGLLGSHFPATEFIFPDDFGG